MFSKGKRKTKTGKLLKRAVSLAAAAAIVLTTTMTAFADSVSYPWNSSLPYVKSRKSATSSGVTMINGSKLYIPSGERITQFKPSGSSYYAFCAIPPVTFNGSTNASGFTAYTEDDWNNIGGTYWQSIPKLYKLYMGLVNYYGYANGSTDYYYYEASQLLNWEILLGYRTCDRYDSTKFASSYDRLDNDMSNYCTALKNAYDDIVSKVSKHYTVPSAMYSDQETAEANPYQLKFDWATQTWKTSFSIENSMLTNSKSNYSGLESALESAGFDVTTTKGSSKTKFVVSTKKGNIDDVTVSVEQNIETNLKAKGTVYFKSDYYQTLFSGTPSIDRTIAYISFTTANEPNAWLKKVYYKSDGTKYKGTELENLLSQTTFRMSTTYSGSNDRLYVVAELVTESNGKRAYEFKKFTTDESKATLLSICEDYYIKSNGVTVGGKVLVENLPSSSSGKKYKVEEVGIPAGNFTALTKTISLPATNSNESTTINFQNDEAESGFVELQKNFLDENGTATSEENIAASFKIAYWDNGLKFITGAQKNEDGTYSLYTTTKGSAMSLDSQYTSSNFSKGSYFSLVTDTESDYFGTIHIKNVPLDSNGNAMKLMFIEVSHPDYYGISENVDTSAAIDMSSITKAQFESFDGLFTSDKTTSFGDVYIPAVTSTSNGKAGYASMDNQIWHCRIKLTKLDSDTKAPVSDAVYAIYNSNGNIVDTATTDENGVATFETPLSVLQTYTLKEIIAPDGYALSDYAHEISYNAIKGFNSVAGSDYIMLSDFSEFTKDTYKPDGTPLSYSSIFSLLEEPYKLQINVLKMDEEHTMPLANATFDVITNQDLTADEVQHISSGDVRDYKAGEVIATITTDDSGNAEIYGLPLGSVDVNTREFAYTYTLAETSAPEHYVLDDTPVTVVTSVDDVSAEATAEKSIALTAVSERIGNEMQGVVLNVHKESNYGKKIEGVVFDVYANEDIVAGGKTLYTKGELIGSLPATDSDGNTSSLYTKYKDDSLDLPYDYQMPLYSGFKYLLVEEAATVPDCYIVNDPITFTADFDSTANLFDISYQVNVIEKEKEGNLEIVKSTTNGKLLEGVKFIISGTSDSGREIYETAVTDKNGVAKINNLPIGTYTLEESADSVPAGYVVSDSKDVTIVYNKTVSEDVVNDTTKVEISKKKITGDDELPGASLKVLDEDGKVIDSWTSGSEPHMIEGVLKAGGTYTLHEEIAPNGYVIANDVKFTVSKDGSVDKVKMLDDTTKVEISKKKITGDDELPGASLKVLDEDGNTVDSWTSGSEPHMIEGVLKAGSTYTLHEEIAPDGYVIANDIEFTVSKDGSVDKVTMIDKPTSTEFTKKSITGENELPGASLKVLDKDGNIVDSWISTDEPHLIEGVLTAGGTYTLHEEIAPDGYIIANDIEFTVSKDGSVDKVTMIDDTTKVHIAKYDADSGEILAGAELQILDSNGNVVDEWTSTTEEHIVEAVLKAGATYTLHETKAPEYFELADDVEFTVSSNGEIDKVTMSDIQKKGNIEIQKTTEGMLNLGNISFTLSGTSNLGHEVSITAVTDENGIALFEHIPVGTYTVTEDGETTPYAYLTADPIEVEVFYAETTTTEIHNDEKTGTIEVHKTTEGMLNLDGIDFVLGGTSDSGREISVTATTDENGIATFENIPIGTYTITEDGKTTPTAYMVADSIDVAVYYAETTTQEIHNDEKTGSIEVHKTTENMTNIEGISFILSGTSDSGREISITAVTDKDGIATFENIPIGTYTITEEAASVPTGYLVASDTDVEVYYSETTTVEVLNDTTKVKISKQDATTGKEISGAKLQVIDKDGNVVEEWTSTNEPHLIEGKLKAGETYTLHEDLAPTGYDVASDISFTVNEDGSVLTVVMKDEITSTPDSSSPPTTTTSTPNPGTGTAAAGTSVVLGLACAVVFFKSKKENK